MRLTLAAATALAPNTALADTAIDVGPRPLFLVDRMEDGPLKDRLAACAGDPVARTDFSIGRALGAAPFARARG